MEMEKDSSAQGQLRQDAEEAFEEAIRLDPDRPGPHRELSPFMREAREIFRGEGESPARPSTAPGEI